MPNEIDIYQPRYLAEVVRQAPPVRTFFRDTFFPRVVTFATERVDIDLVKGDRRMAAFVHPRAGGQVLRETGYETKSYKPPFINPYDMTTADRLMNRLPGETLYSGQTPAQRAAQKLMDEYTRLNDAVTRREEWMAAQVILNGEVDIVGKGVNETIDFGFTNKVVLTGDERWGQSGAKILDNLNDWADMVEENGFANVDRVILGKSAIRALMADPDIQKRLDNRRYNIGEISPRDLPNGVRYYGHLNDPDLDLYTYREVYLDDWTDPEMPETKRLMPDNKIILAPSNPDFIRAYGASSYLDEGGQWVTAQTDRLLFSYVKHGPDRRFLELQSRPLLIPDKVDSWLVAEVC
jgi:hypothetical protein